MVDYLLVKFAHVFVAIVALGTSAGLGILLEFYADDPQHGAFLLRAIHRMEMLVVLPGFALMLATGVWMVTLTWAISTPWIQAGIALWALAVALLGAYLPLLHKQIRIFEQEGNRGARYRQIAFAGRALGAAAGLVVVLIVYVMVAKPELPWWPTA